MNPNLERLHSLLNADPQHPHIHRVDMPYRLTSSWQEQGCEVGMWERDSELVAWAVFQSPWWNLDYALQPSLRGSSLEKEVFVWGQAQMKSYAQRSGEEFWGSVEFFADTPGAEQTTDHLAQLGFQKFDWSVIRLEIDLNRELPQPQLPDGFAIRPLRGEAEVADYVRLHRAAFDSNKMTVTWRQRTLQHPAYKPEIDLVAVTTGFTQTNDAWRYFIDVGKDTKAYVH